MGCEPGLFDQCDATHLWITSIGRPAIFKERLGDQTARLERHSTRKRSFGTIRRSHFLVQGTKLYETGRLQPMPFITRHRATYILLRICESSARFGDLRRREIPLRSYGPP